MTRNKVKIIIISVLTVTILSFVAVYLNSIRLNPLDDNVYNLVTTFNHDAKTSRSFAWTSNSEHSDMVIKISKESDLFPKKYITKDAEFTKSGEEENLFYKVSIENLESGTKYEYKIGDIEDNIWYGPFYFTTQDTSSTPFSFIAITDPQGSEQYSYDLLKQLMNKSKQDAPDAAFTVSLGDMINSQDYSTSTDEKEWKMYFDSMSDSCTSIPHMTVIGNHETRSDDEKLNSGLGYSLHFNNPKQHQNKVDLSLLNLNLQSQYFKGLVKNIDETIYSFDYKNAHIAVLNTGSDWHDEDQLVFLNAQKAWLENDLALSDAKWKILMLHQGFFSARSQRTEQAQKRFDMFKDIIDKYNVNLVLQGHDHIYMRTYPIAEDVQKTYDGDILDTSDATIYTILGAAADKRYDDIVPSKQVNEYAKVWNNTEFLQPVYTVFNVFDDRIEVVAKQLDSTVVDKYTIIE